MADDNQELVDEASQVAWWMRWLATGAGILGGVTCILSGVFMSITHLIDPKGLIGCVIMLLLGFLSFVLEATFLCRGVSIAQPVIQRMDIIKFWHRGGIYCGLSMLSFVLLASSSPMSAIGALIMPFATGTLYGLMSLGRKADREQMLQSARADQPGQGDDYQQFTNEEP